MIIFFYLSDGLFIKIKTGPQMRHTPRIRKSVIRASLSINKKEGFC